MRLLKGSTFNPVFVYCVDKAHKGSKGFWLNAGYADLDGAPFKDYYCAECAQKHQASIITEAQLAES